MPTPSRIGRGLLPVPLLTIALMLPSCSSSSHKLVLNVDPPQASVYINGERVGQGGKRPYDLSFGSQERVYVQATAPNYEPFFDWLTEEKVIDLLDRDLEFPVYLRQRR